MAITHDDRAFSTHPRGSLARGFVLGRDVSAYEWVSARLATLFVRGERSLPDERRPLGPAVAKLVIWIVVGIAFASIVTVAGGALVFRLYTGASG
jgi:hypothetical protein